MGKDELISKLSTFIRNENYAKIDEIIKKFREESNYEMICFFSQAFINLHEFKEALKILDSIKESWRLTKKGKFKFFITIGIFELIYAIISFTTVSLTVSLLAFIDPKGNNFIIETVFFTILSATIFFFGALSKVTSITAIITVLIEQDQIWL